MNLVLCLASLLIAIGIYPTSQLINPELMSFWGIMEDDIFNWYRMLVLGVVAIAAIPLLKKANWKVWAYLVLLLISYFGSSYPITGLYGTPNHHEGLISLLGYVGVYLIASRVGLTKQLEMVLSAVVFLGFFVCALQWHYGNFLDFPLFKAIFPTLPYKAVTWPLYGLLGNPNHLGLFCSLFIPYCLVRKRWVQAACLIAMLVGSQNRAAFISLLFPLCFIARLRPKLIIAVTAILLVLVFMRGVSDIHWPLQERDLGNRIHMWKTELPLIKKNILIGDGPGTYPILIKQDAMDRAPFFGIGVVADRPHSLYLNVWQVSGLLSLLLLGWITLANIINSGDNSLRFGAIAYLINSIFTDSVLCVTPCFLIFLGAMHYGSNNEKNRHRERVSESGPTFSESSPLRSGAVDASL